jgi:hypothetical protein
MLRPESRPVEARPKDICVGLRDDIEIARKKKDDRRFQSILDHAIDCFYDWMVEILGKGDLSPLGERPCASPALRRWFSPRQE